MQPLKKFPNEVTSHNLNPNYRWYSLCIANKEYVFRAVTRRELRLAGTKDTTYESETVILDFCVEGKHDWDYIPAGIPKRILHNIYLISGLVEAEGYTTFQEAANWLTSPEGKIEACAVMMVNGCTLEVLDTADAVPYAKYCMLGKFAFENTFGIPVEQAFATTAPKEHNIEERASAPATPGPGEVGHNISDYAWRKPGSSEFRPPS